MSANQSGLVVGGAGCLLRGFVFIYETTIVPGVGDPATRQALVMNPDYAMEMLRTV